MRKKTIKAKIASLLSASMVLTILAPAMPAHALPTDPKLIFDFKTKNPAVAGILDNWEVQGTKGTLFKDATEKPLPSGWTIDSTTHLIGLPYWKSMDLNQGSDSFSQTTNSKGFKWDTEEGTTGLGMKGYTITGWRDSGNVKVNRVEQPYFQSADVKYFALIGDDGNNVASYWVTRKGVTDDIYVPVKGSNATEFKAGAPISVSPETPVGYTLANVSKSDSGKAGERTVEVYKSQTTNTLTPETLPSGDHYVHEDGVAVDFDTATKTVSGKAHNRDMVINYRYAVDNTQNFNVNVWDIFFDANGNEISKSKRTTISRNVLGSLKGTKITTTDTSTSPATVTTRYTGDVFNPSASDNITTPNATTTVVKTEANIGFDTDMIETPSGSTLPPKYVKMGSATDTPDYLYPGQPLVHTKPVTVVFSKEKSTAGGAADGDFEASNMVDANLNTTTAAPTTENKSFNIDTDFTIHGKMIYQKVDIYYNYKFNLAYFRNITVQYVDENGTNITDKVIAAAAESSYTGPQIGNTYDSGNKTRLYKNNNELILKVDAHLGTTHVNIPIPKLTGYKFNSASDLSIEPTEMTKWTANYSPAMPSITMAAGNAYATAEVWQTSSANDSVVLRVMYTKDAAQLVKIDPEPTLGGDIKVADALGNLQSYDTASHVEHQKYVERQTSTTPGMAKVTITADDLPEPVPNSGYLFDKWVYEGSGAEFTSADLPKDFEIPTGAPGSPLSMKFKAVFKIDAEKYNTYHLESGDGYTSFIGEKNPSILNVDSSGNHIDIHFSDLGSYTGVNLGIVLNPHPFGTNYNVVWYAGNDVILKLDSSGTVLEHDDRAIVNDETFKVYVESNVTPTAYDPQLDNGAGGTPELLNADTGEVQMVIDPANPAPMSPAINYVITDETGKVLKVISGTDLVSNGGVISNNIADGVLTPGNKYKVYTALRSAAPVVGSQIPTTGVSATPIEVTVPVAPAPLITADTDNQGKAKIKLNPTADNTEYALVDDDGNIVYPFTTPTTADNGTVEFKNLDPDTIYHVVPRAVGSGTSIPDRMSQGAQLPVDTSNLGLSVSNFKVDVFTSHPGSPVIQQVKIDGNSATVADLDTVKKGKVVEIVAPMIDAASNNFYTWRVVSPSGMTVTQGTGGTPASPASSRIVFTMPNGPVKLQIMYDDGVVWDADNWTGNNASNKNIGVTVPVVNVPGGSQMRISVKKDSVTANIKQLIADTLTEEYRPEYMFRIALEKKDSSGNWVEYTDPSGDISLDDVRINTGALDFSKNYMLHELATSSNAVSLVKENIGRISSTSADPSYTGEFVQNMTTGRVYVFGASKPLYHKVKIVDNRDNTLVTSLNIPESNTVKDYESSYSGRISADYVDSNGITWHYEGLSTDKDTYQAYDPTLKVTADGTIYIFYSNDRSARKKAEDDLKAGIQNANDQLAKIVDPVKKAALQAAIDAAQAVLDKTSPRKASTPELTAALEALNKAVKDAGGKVPDNNNHNGGGGGGGSRGGGGSSKKSGTVGNPIKVGYDGNWELLNPAEAQKNLDASKWVFNLTNGGRVSGWAYLSYTYEGVSKSEWYHFGTDNNMDSGWFLDGATNKWYYLSTDHNGFFGEMKTGWILDNGKWYYLNPGSGEMITGWAHVDNKYYYLNTASGQAGKPYGAMFANERTPDGYNVDANGVWN